MLNHTEICRFINKERAELLICIQFVLKDNKYTFANEITKHHSSRNFGTIKENIDLFAKHGYLMIHDKGSFNLRRSIIPISITIKGKKMVELLKNIIAIENETAQVLT